MSLSLSKKRRNAGDSSSFNNGNDESGRNGTKRAKRSDLDHQDLEQDTSHYKELIRCGKVLRMQLTNFMCHSNLSIDFSVHMNFVLGSNGSGKSAIIAALVLGLGGKARATNRSGNLKQFIKTGETSAKVSIVISNNGPESFEHEVYGDEITVTRNITMNSSTYSIKNKYGNVISKRVDDLQRILLYHNIQVDNVAFVLNQDSAREFLKDFEPKKNYSLFLKASQIEVILQKLNECTVQRNEQSHNLKRLNSKNDDTKLRISEIEKKLRQLDSARKLRKIVKEYNTELAWLKVKESEKEIQEIDEKIAKVLSRKEEMQRKLENRDDEHTQLTQQLQGQNQSIIDKTNEYNELNNKCLECKTNLRRLEKSVLEEKSVANGLKKRKIYYEDQLRELQAHLAERSQHNIGDIAAVRQQNEANLAKLRISSSEIEAMIANSKRDLNLFRNDILQKEEEIRAIKSAKINLQTNYERLTQQMKNIKSNSKDRLSLFGNHVPALRAEIAKYFKDGRFSKMPIGPLGYYIEVKNPENRDVVESQLGSLLHAFVVNNKDDCNTLEDIFAKKFPQARKVIVTSKFQKNVYDVERGRVSPPPGTFVLIDEIKCSDPVIMNCIIDRVQVETILLTKHKKVAENITANRENVPRNFQKVIIPQLGLEYYPEPNYRMYSVKINPARYIQVDIQQRLNQLEGEREKLLEKLRNSDLDLQQLQQQNDTNLINDKKRDLQKLDEKFQEIQEKINELENYEYPEFNEIDILKREEEELMKKYNENEFNLNQKKTSLMEIEGKKQKAERECSAVEEAMMEARNALNALKIEADQVGTKLKNFVNYQKNQESIIQTIEEKLNKALRDRDVMNTKMLKQISSAEAKGPRALSGKSSEEIQNDIESIQEQIRRNTISNEDPEKLQSQLEELVKDLEETTSMYNTLNDKLDMLSKSLRRRHRFMQILRQHMAVVLQFTFSLILKYRNCSGRIEADHENKTLNVVVIPRDEDIANAVDNVKSLSGGERSYATIGFLMALWGIIDHPFFFLDEYDVFTDEITREFITRLLLREGTERSYRQYCYLTPLDTAIAPRPDVKIHRLQRPLG